MMTFGQRATAKGSVVSQEKMWGSEPYWGLSYDWDADWMLTERHKELRAKLIDLCQQEMHAAGPGGRIRGQGADREVT
jgi:hypothetical protein